jgi:hypothetical protein
VSINDFFFLQKSLCCRARVINGPLFVAELAPTFFDSLLYKRSRMWHQWFSPGVSGSREFRHNANEDALGAISTTRPGTRRTETGL